MNIFDQCAMWTGRVVLGAVCCATPLALAWLACDLLWRVARRFIFGWDLFYTIVETAYATWFDRRQAKRWEASDRAAEAKASRGGEGD